jgi:hypothetical protein
VRTAKKYLVEIKDGDFWVSSGYVAFTRAKAAEIEAKLWKKGAVARVREIS